MSQAARDPAYLLIEDQLDAIGQKYRAFELLRGVMLFAMAGLGVSLAAALAAHLLGQSGWNWAVLGLWLGWLALSAGWWLVRPLLLRPRALEVARLVEDRLPHLHNGLTNGVLLAKAEDLRQSPWLPAIFQEIHATMQGAALDQAVRLSDLKRPAVRLGLVAAPVLLWMWLWPAPLLHGFGQMLHPASFVPQAGAMTIVEIKPGDATLVAGQPLEISILARGPGTPEAMLLFDSAALGQASLPSSPADNGQLRYTYRIDHVDEPLKYRVEVGGTQSAWHAITLVKQVKLAELLFTLTPPGYTGQGISTIALKADEIGKTPLAMPQGSKVEVVALTDVAVSGGMLQVNAATPVAMEASASGKRFAGSFVCLEDAALSLLFTAGGQQIIAALPEPPLEIHCAKDAEPRIEMKWPGQDASVDPQAPIKLQAVLRDDYGLAEVKVLTGETQTGDGSGAEPLMSVAWHKRLEKGKLVEELAHELEIKPELRRHGHSLFVQLEVSDNRELSAYLKDGGAQVTVSPRYQIKFRDATQIAREEKEKSDKLRARLLELLKKQQDLHAQAVTFRPKQNEVMAKVNSGQIELRELMRQTAESFEFDGDTRSVQKTLLMLVHNPAAEAVDLSASILTEPIDKEQSKLSGDLQSRQRRIMTTLESLLAILKAAGEPATRPTTRAGEDLANPKESFEQLKEALDRFIKEEKRILDQTAPLAKKPVDNWDEKDKQLAEELRASQEKLDAFMQEKVHDFSKLAEQDMANASLLKELLEVYSEVTMAKDALKDKAMEIAVAAEEMGVELAKEISSNLEKWLMDTPDRIKWTQEDPLAPQDVPMAELPAELEDMVGELMEEQEDLFQDVEDANANWADSLDKGAGWDAMDGPIANMSAKGVTGNALPNNNEMGGRSGEGRSGKSQGEMVEETASGKGGRMTPTRLDPTAFQQGQIKDESKDPVGGATGGGKISGQGGAGLEGPLGPKTREEYLKRLAQKQAELRNTAEKLNLQHQLGRYDNFKLLESIALMRRVESDLSANRYQTALRRRDVLLDDLDTSRLLLGGRIHVQQDTSPTMSKKLEDKIHDAMQGQLPAAWSGPLKEYYRKLAQE